MRSILNPLSSDELDKVAENMRSAARTIGDTKGAAYDCMRDVHDIEDEAFAEMCHRAEATAIDINRPVPYSLTPKAYAALDATPREETEDVDLP